MQEFDFPDKPRPNFELTKVSKEQWIICKAQKESCQWINNTKSAKGPTHGEVVFLFDDSPCFMIIAPFVLKVVGIRMKVIY